MIMTMKKHLTYIIAGILAFTGCDSFLDIEPQSVITQDNAYNDNIETSVYELNHNDATLMLASVK